MDFEGWGNKVEIYTLIHASEDYGASVRFKLDRTEIVTVIFECEKSKDF